MAAIRPVKMLLAAAACVFSLAAHAQHDTLFTLHDQSWLCATPDDYAHALALTAENDGRTGPIEAKLRTSKQCILIVEDDIEDIMAPFVQVTERQDELVKVVFTVEFYRRIELLHRNITRATFTGWTGNDNLRNYHQWLTGKPQD